MTTPPPCAVALSAALGSEITVAGDAGEDAAYAGLTALRAAVVRDLTVRGASLPSVVTVALRQPMPALAIAQMLYRDASRSDEIVAASNAIHPAFCPVSFQTLTSGMAPHVNPARAGADLEGQRCRDPAGGGTDRTLPLALARCAFGPDGGHDHGLDGGAVVDGGAGGEASHGLRDRGQRARRRRVVNGGIGRRSGDGWQRGRTDQQHRL